MRNRIYKILIPSILRRLSARDIIESIFSYDFVYPVAISVFTYTYFYKHFTKEGMSTFIELGTTVSGSLVAVILTGLAIIISVSDLEFLSLVEETVEIEHILKPFEYTLLIALISTSSGIILSSLAYKKWVFFIYFFVFFYLLFSILDVVDSIIKFSNKKSRYAQIDNMEDLPDQFKQDFQDAVEAQKRSREVGDEYEDEPTSESDEG